MLHLGGWNDNVFKVVDYWMDGGNDAIVEAVKAYRPRDRRQGPAETLGAESD